LPPTPSINEVVERGEGVEEGIERRGDEVEVVGPTIY
jgi:hypothetical protein